MAVDHIRYDILAQEALRGVVFRRPRGEAIDARIERDVAAANAEIESLEAADAQAA